ncbi:MAG TPA: hypothetical protein VHO06_07500 [Polyangia bacterium]|nr:hypothetical protein [Polyangia bacterium]
MSDPAPAPVDPGAAAGRRLLSAALAFLFGALFFERLSGATGFDPDGFHQMALFRAWLRTGALPLHDTFAFTHTVVPAVQHEWGAGAVLYALATAGGGPAVMLARWLISAAVAVVATAAAARRAPAVVVAFCAPFAVVLGQVGFTTIRAGLYTMLFLAAFLAALDRDRDDARAGRFLVVYLPVMALWINLHGGFIVGVAAVALHAGEQALRRRPIRHLVAALAATPLLMAATPYGRAFFPGWWRSVTFPRDQIAEWLPLYRSGYLFGVLTFGLAVLFLLYALARRGPLRLPGLAFVLATAWAALRHERHVALFALAWFCAVPGYLAATPLGELLEAAVSRRRVRGALVALSAAVGVALVAVALPRHPFRLRLPAQGSDLAAGGVVYPAGAVAYLAEHGFHGKLVTSFVNGGFVIWKLAPAARVSFDGRYEVAYAPEVLDEDRTIHRARPGWQALLARYAPDAVLVARTEPLAAALPGGSGLARVYRDDAYEVWARPALGLPPADRTGRAVPTTFP